MSEGDPTLDPALKSWVESANNGGDFPIQNLPIGIFSEDKGRRRPGRGDRRLHPRPARDRGRRPARRRLGRRPRPAGAQRLLRARPSGPARAARAGLANPVGRTLSRRCRADADRPERGAAPRPLPGWRLHRFLRRHSPRHQCRPAVPARQSACFQTTNICRSAIMAARARSGHRVEDVIRPNGQRKPPDADVPEYGPSRRLDYELELGLWIGRGTRLGTPIPIQEAERPYRGLQPAQRLVGARHPGVGISAAGSLPGQELPDQRQRLGRQPGRAGSVPLGDARAPRGRSRATSLSRRFRGPLIRGPGDPTRSHADDRRRCAPREWRRTCSRAARPIPRCIGARRRSSPSTPPTAATSSPATSSARARCRPRIPAGSAH